MDDVTGDVTYSGHPGLWKRGSGDIFPPLGTEAGFVEPEVDTIWGTVFKKNVPTRRRARDPKQDWGRSQVEGAACGRARGDRAEQDGDKVRVARASQGIQERLDGHWGLARKRGCPGFCGIPGEKPERPSRPTEASASRSFPTRSVDQAEGVTASGNVSPSPGVPAHP